jgi:hypothetical protein
MKNIRDWESRRTHQAWGTGSGNPALMVLTCLIVNVIALLATVVVAVVVATDGQNDYAEGQASHTTLKSRASILTIHVVLPGVSWVRRQLRHYSGL